MKKLLVQFRNWVERINTELSTLYFAIRDPKTPRIARLLSGGIILYALSPIDLIPDFLPIIGSLDDLIIIPLGIWLVIKLIPEEVLADARLKAINFNGDLIVDRRKAIAIIASMWLIIFVIFILFILSILGDHEPSTSPLFSFAGSFLILA